MPSNLKQPAPQLATRRDYDMLGPRAAQSTRERVERMLARNNVELMEFLSWASSLVSDPPGESQGETAPVDLSSEGVWSIYGPSPGVASVLVSPSEDKAAGSMPTPSVAIDARIRSLHQSYDRFSVVARSLSSQLARIIQSSLSAKCSGVRRLNQRRLGLIDKDIEYGLSAAEKAELDGLEKKAQDHLDANAPVSFGIIEQASEECA